MIRWVLNIIVLLLLLRLALRFVIGLMRGLSEPSGGTVSSARSENQASIRSAASSIVTSSGVRSGCVVCRRCASSRSSRLRLNRRSRSRTRWARR